VIESLPLIGAALATGLLGSTHCFAMCGGISGLFAVNASASSLRRDLPMAITYNLGRVLGYALLGAAVALLGQSIVDAIPRLTAPVRLLSGVLIVLVGLQVAFNWRALAPIEKAGASLWRRFAPAAQGLLPVTSAPRALGLGFLWGWLPCGLVYSVLLLAATTANALTGSLVMLAFGLGTMPAMIATGLSASRLSAFMSRQRLGAGLLIVILGLATLAMPVMKLTAASGDANHDHHSKSAPLALGVEPLFKPCEHRIRVQHASEIVDERIAGFLALEFVLHAEKEWMRRQEYVASEISDDAGARNDIVRNATAGKLETGRRYRAQAVRIDDVVAGI